MIKIGRFAAFAIVAVFTFSAGALAQPQVRTNSGTVVGAEAGDVVVYKGIPFAQPPVGDLRWRAPQPIKPWHRIRVADKYGADCMQIPFEMDAAPLGVTPSEDCLYANVWAPPKTVGKKYPVMVWIYGGGFVNGGSSPPVYSGVRFAESGVVFVSFNYRVGRFGFFAHPALTKEASGAPHGNYGVLDQIAALKWVKRNIAAFGGDPGNVTIFGESAGGGSVHTLATTPLAKGLFNKAIVMSGGGRDMLGPPRSSVQAEAIGVEFAKAKGIGGDDPKALKALRALSAEKVMDKLNLMTLFTATSFTALFVDGQIVTAPIDRAYMAGKGANIPMMIGANDADGFFFGGDLDKAYAPVGPARTEAQTIYDPEGKQDPMRIGVAVAADLMMLEPARHVARIISQRGQPVYYYRFGYVPDYLRSKLPGAFHASELPFIFNTVEARHGPMTTDGDRAAARLAQEYWVNFAKTGVPFSTSGGKWSKYDATSDEIMIIDEKGAHEVPDPFRVRLDFAERLATMMAKAAARPAQ